MNKKQSGFTIIELLIATTVFTVVMIICLAAFLRVGQLYYKGIYLSRTQEITRNISDDLVSQLRLNGQPIGLQKSVGQINKPGGGSYDVYYMCAGTKRYSLMSNNVVDTQTESTTNFGLVSDNLPSNGCTSPTIDSLAANWTELLSDKMRVVATSVLPGQSDLSETCPSNPNLACVHIHVDFGDSDLLVDPLTNASFTTNAAGFVGGSCSGPLQGSQFCATTELDTTIYPRQ